jgi:endo-1,4-beta-xylanase
MIASAQRFRSRLAASVAAAFIICGADTASAWTGNVKFFGAALNAGTDPNQTYKNGTPFAQYFNGFTEDASMGMVQLQPNGPSFSGGTIDGSTDDYNYAKSKGFPFRWNTALYRDPSQGAGMPQWFGNSSQPLTDWRNFLQGIANAMPNIDQIEVYNEPIHTSPSANIYNALGGGGSTGWDWLIQAFHIVRSIFPNSKLGVNEWAVEVQGDSARGGYIDLLQKLKNAGVLDWVGLEGYFGNGFPDRPSTAALSSGIDDLAAQVPGVPIYFTEVSFQDGDANAQLQGYQQIIPAMMNNINVQGVAIYNPDYEGAPFGSPAMNWLIANIPLPFAAGAGPTPTPSPSPSPSPGATPTPSPSPTATPSPSPNPSASPSPSSSPSPSPVATPTPSATPEPTPTPVEVSPTPTPTPESTPVRGHHRHHLNFEDFLSLWEQFIQWLQKGT